MREHPFTCQLTIKVANMSNEILTQEVIKERFFNKVLKLPSGCWLWMGAIQGKFYKRDNGGYGSFRYFGVVTPAHIASFRIHNIEIPDGMHIDHLCRITSCVNPDHLEPVTPLENFNRGIGNKGENSLCKTHCPNGHEYTEYNTLHLKNYKNKKNNTYRSCRKCRAETDKKSKLKLRLKK